MSHASATPSRILTSRAELRQKRAYINCRWSAADKARVKARSGQQDGPFTGQPRTLIAIEGQRQLVRIKRVRVPYVPEALLDQSFVGVTVVVTRRPWKPVGANAESYEPSGMGSAEHKYNFLQIRPDQYV